MNKEDDEKKTFYIDHGTLQENSFSIKKCWCDLAMFN